MTSTASQSSDKDPPFDFHKPAYEVAQSSNVITSGLLNKQDRKMGVMWRKRFFILIQSTPPASSPSSTFHTLQPSSPSDANILLYYFKNPTDSTSISSIPIRYGLDRIETVQYNKTNRKYGIKLVTKGQREYFLCCEDETEHKKWMNYLNLAKMGSPLVLQQQQQSSPLGLSPLNQQVSVSTPSLAMANKIVIHHQVTADSEELKHWMDWSQNQCQVGAKVVKLPYMGLHSGKEKKRFMQLSKNGDRIRWGRQTIHKSSCKMTREEDEQTNLVLDRHVQISHISQIYYGNKTSTFQRYLNKTMHSCDISNCLSLRVGNRTIDLIFDNSQDTMAWYLFLTLQKTKTGIHQVITQYKWSRLQLQTQQKCYLDKKKPLAVLMEELVYSM